MKDEDKTKAELISEMEEMRRRVAQLEQAALEQRCLKEALLDSEEKCRVLDERWKKERELRLSILNSSADAIVIYDMEGRTQYVSPSFTHMFGWTLEQVKGSRIPFVPDSERESTMEIISSVVHWMTNSGRTKPR